MSMVATDSGPPPERRSQRTYTLRCYTTRRPKGHYVGVCLKPNLVVHGYSEDHAKEQLDTLIDAYMDAAAKDNRLPHFMSQRAPLRFHVEYWLGRLMKHIRALNGSFRPLRETRTVQRRH